MLAVEVVLLTGRYVAARFGDRDRSEWPPHPARLFSALVAAWGYEDPPSQAERAVLAWLADQNPPEISCGDSTERAVVTHYVPVNDAAVVRDHSGMYRMLVDAERALADATIDPRVTDRDRTRARQALDRALAKAAADSARLSAARGETAGTVISGLRLLPERRVRQARTYPTAVPDDTRVCFSWPAARPDPAQRASLDAIAARVHRLGHSSSMVACKVLDGAPPRATWVPDAAGDTVLRAPAHGLLDRLEAEHRRHRGEEPRSLPAALVTYRRGDALPEPTAVSAPWLGDDWLVLARAEGPVLPLRRALDLTQRLRSALLHHAEDPIPELLSGHARGPAGESTSPTDRPHLALLALPFVGHRYADGSLLGIALVFPRESDPGDRRTALRAVARWREAGAALTLGRAGVARFTLTDALDPRTNLRADTWCRRSRRWVSVTPVALDRFPRHLDRGTPAERAAAWGQAEGIVATACQHAGLPRPSEVQLSASPPLVGVPPVSAFPRYETAGGRIRRLSVHARLAFSEPVRGPVLIGAGRYLGYGLCRPVA